MSEAVYCNTCTEYPLEDAAKPDAPIAGRAMCAVRQQLYAWDSRACMFYSPVSLGERETRRPIAVELYRKDQADAQAKNPTQARK